MKAQFLIALALTSTLAMAGPPMEHPPSNCKAVGEKIVNPKGSAGYYLDADCSTAYVLPPDQGQIAVATPFLTDSSLTCAGIMGSVNAYSALSVAYQQSLKEQSSVLGQIAADRQACMGVHGAAISIQNLIGKLQDQLAKINVELESKTALKAACEKQPENKGCGTVDNEIKTRQARIDQLNQKLDEVNGKNDKVQSRVAECEARHPRSKDSDTDGQTRLETLATKIEDLSKKVITAKARLQDLKGGLDTGLSFNSGQMGMVQAYRDANAGLKISFTRMPIKNGTIHFEMVHDGRAAGLASVTRFRIHGMPDKSPASQAATAVPTGGDFEINTEETSVVFGGAAGGEISLNPYSACVLRQQFANITSPLVGPAIANLVRPTVNYSYELQASKNIKIHYNEEYLYQLIKEQTTRGGFFWTSSSTSILEKTVSDKWLTIEENWDDADLAWEAPEALLMKLRQEVLDVALGRVAVKSYDTPQAATADGGTPPPNGAGVAASNLHKMPYFYCQVAAIVLDVANAVFGGSSSSADFTRTIHKSDVQNLTINGMVKFWGSQSFQAAGS